MKRVVIESPFAGPHGSRCICAECRMAVQRNLEFARACKRDCLLRGEAPFASHTLYTQPGVLRDEIDEERKLGMLAGFAWGRVAEARIVYTNRGVSKGMLAGVEAGEQLGQEIVRRVLEGWED